MTMHYRFLQALTLMAGITSAVSISAAEPTGEDAKRAPTPWCGVHLFAPRSADIPLFKRAIDEVFVPAGGVRRIRWPG